MSNRAWPNRTHFAFSRTTPQDRDETRSRLKKYIKNKNPSTMFSTTFAVIALASMTSFIAEAGSQEIYLYTIYYDQTSCGKTAVSLVGHSSNDDEYSVSATDNTTELCSVESTCLMNNNSDICQSLGPSSPVWGRADINPDGNIFECDDSNSVIDQAVCRVLDQCHQSSKYPHCSFSLATTSTLFENRKCVFLCENFCRQF